MSTMLFLDLPRVSDAPDWCNRMSFVASRAPKPNNGEQVIADGEAGLLFKNKRDRKVVNVDPKAAPGDNTTRTEIRTPEYRQVVIYDHMTRRKS